MSDPYVTPRRVAVIYNPTAGRARRDKLNAVILELQRLGCRVELNETHARGDAEEIAGGIDDARVDIVAAAGGDGTVNEVVNGLKGKAVALAVIPLGTANVLADEIDLGRKVKRIAEAIAFGGVRPIRVGNANGRRFVMMAGAGFDAKVVDGVQLGLKRFVGPLAYVWEMVRQVFVYGWAPCRVEVDGQTYQVASAIVCNGQSYGGPFTAAPAANLETDCFQIVMFTRSGWFNVVRYGLALVIGRLPHLADVRIVPGRHVVIHGDKGAPVQADGDILTRLPAHIEIDSETVQLAFPA